MRLNEIGLKYGTDKATTHFYMDTYEKHLQQWRDKEFVMIEIGVGNGSSIKTWKEYFPNARVYGIDINPDCAGEGIFIGNQGKVSFLSEVLVATGQPSLIIDDGSHVGGDMITSFEYLFPCMETDGIYVLEDTHCLYSEHYAGKFQGNGRSEAYNYFTDLAYDIDVAGRAMCGNPEVAINWPMPTPPVPRWSRILRAMHIYPSLWILERK